MYSGLQKLVRETSNARVIHLSRYAEEEVREYLNVMYGTSFRGENEKRNDPLKVLLGLPVQIHTEPTDKEYWVE